MTMVDITVKGAIEYTDSISAEGKIPPTSGMDLTLNNLMVRLQLSLPLLPGPIWPGVVALDRIRELNHVLTLNNFFSRHIWSVNVISGM